MKRSIDPRVIVIFNRDFEGAEADPENKAREDIKGIALHLVEILECDGFATGALGVTGDVFGALESIKAYAKFWTTVFDAAKTEDSSIVVDELLYRLFEYATHSPTGLTRVRGT